MSLRTAVERPWIQLSVIITETWLEFSKELASLDYKLNKDKFKLRQTEVKYMAAFLPQNDYVLFHEKVSAITNMKRPENMKAVQRFTGLAAYVSRFLPHILETCESF